MTHDWWTTFLLAPALLALWAGQMAANEPDPVFQAVERAHSELWRRFVNEHGILFDFVTAGGEVIVPTPEECVDCKPNGLGWWCPIENGSFFNGLYLDALCKRWALDGKRSDSADCARRIAQGLMLLARVGNTPGFIARGVATDGRSHHPAGSDDQTLPWFYGLWRYVKSGVPDDVEKREIVAKMVEVARALEANGWRMPCDPASFGNSGSFVGKSPVSVPRLLFVTLAMYDLTQDAHWRNLHEQLRDERPRGSDKTRLEICSDGTLIEEHGNPKRGYYSFWTKASCQACLRVLRDQSDDPNARQHYDQGLRLFARPAAEQIGKFRQFSNDNVSAFTHDWRRLNEWWQPQRTIKHVLAVARPQSKHWHGTLSPRKGYEAYNVREPLFAAWIVLLSDDRELIAAAKDDIRAALTHYDWTKLDFATFFAAECAYFEGVPYGL